MENQVKLLRTRVELPQFDFSGLPQLPSSSSYAKRIQGIKLMGPNTFVIDKRNSKDNTRANSANSESLIYKLTEESVAHREIVMSSSNKNEITLPEIRSKSTQSITRKSKPLSKSLIVGFFKLLEYIDTNFVKQLRITHAEKESEVLECIVGDKDLDYIDENELIFFQNMYYIDVSGNYLPFEKFAVLPSLRELNIGCNALNKVTVPERNGAFSKLEVLNISYNTFSDPYLFTELGKLRSLKKLDLSGNNLQGLPNDLSQFQLADFILEDNVLDHSVFHSLSSITTLVHVNLNKNKIEKIPYIKDSFQVLNHLSLQENSITFHDDLKLMEFVCLEVLDLCMNPISGRPKDVERVKCVCEKKSINLKIDNYVQYPKVPLSHFYKMNQVINVNKINKKKTHPLVENEQEEHPIVEDTDLEEESRESSFFITAVPRLDLKAIQRENNQTSEKILTPRSPFRSPTTKLFNQQSTSEIKKITESYDRMKDIGRKVNVTYDVKDMRQNSKPPVDRYEYNKDWFDLDVALSNVDDSMDEEIKKNIVVPKDKQNFNLYTEKVDLYRTNLNDKKNTYRALKFAIDNPLNLPNHEAKVRKNLDSSTLKDMYQ